MHLGCSTYSQILQTGIYDIGAIAIDKGVITGFIEDGIGDEAYGSPVRTCFLYFEGNYSKSGIHSIYIWDTYDTSKIKKYPGTIEPDPDLAGNFIIKASNVPNIGICPTSTFNKIDNEYVSSMLFVKGAEWRSLRIGKNDQTQIYERKDTASRVVDTIESYMVLKVLSEDKGNKWYKVEVNEETGGWALKEHLYDINDL